jgi:hypothetical protein
MTDDGVESGVERPGIIRDFRIAGKALRESGASRDPVRDPH